MYAMYFDNNHPLSHYSPNSSQIHPFTSPPHPNFMPFPNLGDEYGVVYWHVSNLPGLHS